MGLFGGSPQENLMLLLLFVASAAAEGPEMAIAQQRYQLPMPMQIEDVGTARRPHHHDDDFDISTGTFLFGKLVLVPVLAAVGLKFLALLPIVLSKIALLSVMNFLSTNLNLLVSTLFGLRNFLGKHGLWAQDDKDGSNKIHNPDIEAFAELAGQPIMQSSFRYQYVTEPISSSVSNGVSGMSAEASKPKITKIALNGFVPTDYKLVGYKLNDRRRYIKVREHHQPRMSKESRDGGSGKYKCYWTDEGSADLGFAQNDNLPEHQQLVFGRRKFQVADRPLSDDNGQLDSYAVKQLNDELVPPGEGLGADFYDYRSLVSSNAEDPSYRQVSTEQQQQPQQQPFTDTASTHSPILYLLGHVDAATYNPITTTATTAATPITSSKFEGEVASAVVGEPRSLPSSD